jgi:hypothetical protein
MFRVSSCDVYGNMYRDCVQVVVDLWGTVQGVVWWKEKSQEIAR